MGRIRTGWRLTGKSWRLLRSHPALVRFPLLGALATFPAAIVAAAGVYLIDTHEYAVGAVALVLGTFVSTYIVTFFGVALAACADEILHGRDVGASAGFAVARTRRADIAGWAALSAAVGVLLQVIESLGKAGDIVKALLGASWSLLTFFVIPVIAIEGASPGHAVKRSGQIFKTRFVEGVSGVPAIGLAVFLFAILPAVAVIALGIVLWIADGNGAELAAGGALVAIGILLLIAGALVQTALRGIFGVVLYRFAASDETLGGFTGPELESSVRTRA